MTVELRHSGAADRVELLATSNASTWVALQEDLAISLRRFLGDVSSGMPENFQSRFVISLRPESAEIAFRFASKRDFRHGRPSLEMHFSCEFIRDAWGRHMDGFHDDSNPIFHTPEHLKLVASVAEFEDDDEEEDAEEALAGLRGSFEAILTGTLMEVCKSPSIKQAWRRVLERVGDCASYVQSGEDESARNPTFMFLP